MSKVFLRKKRRITALLLAAAVMAGSMDANMLQAWAQEENEYAAPELAEDALPETESGMTEDGRLEKPDLGSDGHVVSILAEPEIEEDGEEQTDAGNDGVSALADGDEGDPTPTGPQRVTISGITVTDKIYDGSPAVASGTLKAVVLKENSATGNEEDVTTKVAFKYVISGKVADGSDYPTAEGIVPAGGSITAGMPKDAGNYLLTINVEDSGGNYEGTMSTEVRIKKRTITIKANDKTKKIGDDIPPYLLDSPSETDKAQEGRDYTVNNLVDSKDLKTPPTLSCDITNDTKDVPGKYTITPSGADAGTNYIINYMEGTLTVSDKEEVIISGVTIQDKIYDGKPITYSKDNVKVTSNNVEVKGLTLHYSITGKQQDGNRFPAEDNTGSGTSGGSTSGDGTTGDDASGGGTSGDGTTGDDASGGSTLRSEQRSEDELPTEAGEYTLKVTVESDQYRGVIRKDFSILQRPVTLTANDLSCKQGDRIEDILKKFTYTVEKAEGNKTTGLLEKDLELTRQPSFICDIPNTDRIETYTITPRDASAGSNYTITYRTGTLTVLEKDRIAISGIQTEPSPKVYDGKPVICNTDQLKIILNKSDMAGKDSSVDITEAVKKQEGALQYSIGGTKADGKGYSPGGFDMPSEAGEYTITVDVVYKEAASQEGQKDQEYRGSMEYSFTISQRPVVITADNLEIKTEDQLPAQSDYGYKITGMGLVEGDTLRREPTFTCDIQNTDQAGKYDIVPSDADAGFNYRITYEKGTLTVTEKEIVPTRKLLRMIAPAPVRNVENGTSMEKMPLPDKVAIVTREIGAEETVLTEQNETAPVVWNRVPADGTSYGARNEEEQTFLLEGTVELPAEIDSNGVSLQVKVQVNVRERYAAKEPVAVPTASIASGTGVRRGTTIRLSCETEGAEIYYTLDSSQPDRSSQRYANPIEVNVHGFTVIWAYAYKKGQPDSSTVKFFYYINSQTGGEGDEPEVPEEDMPDGGIIPEGLWMTKVKDYTYTGKAIKPEVRVYDYKTRLVEKKDYTVSYANNTKAADQNADKAPTITIIGKGNYEGKLTKHFTILPKDIRDTDVSVDNITVAYNGKAQKPAPAVLWNGKKLVSKKDYTMQDVSYTDAGGYTVTVTGIGNYKGERTFQYTIASKDQILASKLTVSKIPNQTYRDDTAKTGIEPEFTVKYKTALLKRDTDYTVRYENNKAVGTATVVIEGKGTYAGTKKVTFKILEVASLSKAKVDLQFVNTPVYTGREITADSENVTISIKGETQPRKLTKNTDYVVVYTNNVKAGTATATFTGKGAYGGSIKKTFRIAAYDIGRVNIRLNKSYSYVKGGSRPEPIITFGGRTLQAGTDYTLAYKQNNAAGSTAVLTVKGKGNFQGSVEKKYEITQQDIAKMTLSAADKVYQNKKNIYRTTVQVMDTNGKKLAAGRDYDKNMSYMYAENVYDRTTQFRKKEGEPVEQNDIIPAGTKIRVTVTAAGGDYTGTASAVYRITAGNIAKAKVSIPNQTYTGKAIELDPQKIQVIVNGTALKPGEDFEIMEDSYSNHINKGMAKVTLHGLGNYGGTKTVKFKIRGKGLFSL